MRWFWPAVIAISGGLLFSKPRKAAEMSPKKLWCNLPLAVGTLALGWLILWAFEWTTLPVAIAIGLFFVGFKIFGFVFFAKVINLDDGPLGLFC